MAAGIGTSTTMFLPLVVIVPGYGGVDPVFRPSESQLCAGVSTKKNVSVLPPLFQTSSPGSHGTRVADGLKSFVGLPTTALM